MIPWTWMMLRILLVLVLDGALGLAWRDELGSLNDNVRMDLEDKDDNLDDVNEVLDEGVLEDDLMLLGFNKALRTVSSEIFARWISIF